MNKNGLLALALVLAAPATLKAKEDFIVYAPPSRSYSCDIPSDWKSFEEEEPGGTVTHILGAANADNTYRTGIDIHFIESGRPGFVEVKAFVETLRRGDKDTKRAAGALKRVNSGAGPARYLEIDETRRLPPDQAPSKLTGLKQSVAVIANGQSYFVLRLSTVKETFLEDRDKFLRVLKSFRVTGY